MKNTLFITLIIMLSFSSIFSQSIDIEDTEGSKTIYSIDGEMLDFEDLTDIVKDNQVSFKLMKSAKYSFVTSRVIAYAGGFMVGYQLGSAFVGRKPNWFLVGTGLWVAGFSLVIKEGGTIKVEKSVLNYNMDMAHSSIDKFKPKFYLRSNVNGVGIVMNF